MRKTYFLGSTSKSKSTEKSNALAPPPKLTSKDNDEVSRYSKDSNVSMNKIEDRALDDVKSNNSDESSEDPFAMEKDSPNQSSENVSNQSLN